MYLGIEAEKDLFRGRRWLGADTTEQLVALAIYVGVRGLLADRRYSPLSLIEEVMSSADDLRENLRNITDTANWNIDGLLEDARDHRPTWLRRPRIHLAFSETIRGNFRLQWCPDPGYPSDFRYSDYDFERRPPYRDLSELLFIRKFSALRAVVGDLPCGNLEIDIRPLILDIMVGLVEDTIESLEMNFDVTVNNFFITTRDRNGHLTGLKIVGMEEKEKLDAEAEAALKRARLSALRHELQTWEEAHRIGAGETVARWWRMSERRMKIADRLKHLRGIGAAIPQDPRKFESELKRIRTVLSELGELPTEPYAGAIDCPAERERPKAVITDTNAEKPTVARRRLLNRHVSMKAALPIASNTRLPKYPTRKYQATTDELSALGFDTIDQFVSAFNEELAKRKQPPIPEGDYPSNRSNFERLAKRWKSMSGLSRQLNSSSESG